MERPLNPYIAGKDIDGEEGFYNRRRILSQVENDLRNPRTDVLVLFGQRRIGKTTLLKQLRRLLPVEEFAPVFFNLMDRARSPLGQVLAELAEETVQAITEKMPELGAGVKEWPAVNRNDNSGRTFQQEFLPVLLERIGARRLVYLLDEFDVLDSVTEALPKEAAAESLLAFLRRLMSETEKGRLAFVFAYGRNPDDLSQDYIATFKEAVTILVGVFDDLKDARALVRHAEANGTLSFAEEAVERILELTGCHPYLIQLLCQRLWERAYSDNDPAGRPIIGNSDVDDIVGDTLSAGEMAISWLWDGLSPSEKICASALAEISEEKEPIHIDRVKDVLSAYAERLSIHQVERLTPHDLEKRGILVSAGARKYRFAYELLRQWVRQERPLYVVKDELDRIDDLAYAQVELGKRLSQKGKLDEAKIAFEKALEQDPVHLGAHLNLGGTLMQMGRFQDATKILEKAFKLDPQDALPRLVRALVHYAQELYQNGDLQTALEKCDRALALSPRYQSARDLKTAIWTQIGDDALELDDWTAALDAYKQAGNAEKMTAVQELQKEGEREIDLGILRKIEHRAEITSLAFSSNRMFLAAGSGDSEVIIRGANTGNFMRALIGHSDRVNSVAFLAGSDIMASASSDNTVILWDASIFKQVRTLTGHSARVNSVAFSPDGKYLASASSDNTIVLWNVSIFEQVRTLTGHSEPVNSVAFSPDGRYLASASSDQNIILWNVDGGEQLQALTGHSAQVNSVAFSPDGIYLASGSSDCKVILWDAAVTGKQLRILSGHSSDVSGVVFSPSGPFLASGSRDSRVIIWNVISGRQLQAPDENLDHVLSVAFSKDGNLLAASSQDGTIRLWKVTEFPTKHS